MLRLLRLRFDMAKIWAARTPWTTELVGHDHIGTTLQRQASGGIVIHAAHNFVRVIYITPGGIEGRGGMGRMARYLFAAFRSCDVELRAIDPYGPGPFWQMPFRFLASLLSLSIACARRRVDVTHIHMAFGGSTLRKLVLLRVAGFFGVPTILHLHGSEFAVFCGRLSPRLRALMVATMARAARIVVIGSFWRQFLVQDLGIDSGKVVVVANGVPLPPIPRSAPMPANGLPASGPPANGPDDARCRILYLGALGRRKGTSDLLQALASPRLRAMRWNAVIAGNGDVDSFRKEAAALGIADRVTFPGWVGPEEAQALLASAGVFVLPSYNEGLPVAVLEAMAAGVPVVTTRVGAIPDLGIDGEAGFLVDPGSIEDLADRLAVLVDDPVLRSQFGSNGRRRVESEFSIDSTARRLAALYREVSFHN
jgi:glycosyltransferase involved in cell wall biosynthesis